MDGMAHVSIDGVDFSTTVDSCLDVAFVSADKVVDYEPIDPVSMDMGDGETMSAIGLKRFRLCGQCEEFTFIAWVVPASVLPGVDLVAGKKLVREYGRMCRAHTLNPYIHSRVAPQ